MAEILYNKNGNNTLTDHIYTYGICILFLIMLIAMIIVHAVFFVLQVLDLAFSHDGNTFVTVGNRHVKFWYLDASKSRLKETVPLMGRSGILGEQKNNLFIGAAFGQGDYASSTYVITHSGLLCEFNEKRLLDKWVELRLSYIMSDHRKV